MSTIEDIVPYNSNNEDVKNLNKISCIIVLISCWSISCSKNEHFENYSVDEELEAYFQQFEAEADKRNISINLRELGISGHFESISTLGVIAQCVSQTASNHKEIRVDPLSWKRLNSLRKEFLIFHELGHCALNRDHFEERDENGICMSIMHSGTDVCLNNYNSRTRESLLDELFSLN